MNGQMWGEMLDVLKDIGGYLAKQDAIQERAKVDKAPKISETQKAIKGDEDVKHGFEPGKGVAKSTLVHKYVAVPENSRENETFTPDEEETSQLAKEQGYGGEEEQFADDEEGGDEEFTEDEEEGGDDEEYEEEEEEGGEGEPSMEDISQLKSLLKDIRKSLIQQSKPAASSNSGMISKADLQKAIQPMIKAEAQRMIRKMGFNPSRPDIVRLGIEDDSSVIKKSMDERKNAQDAGKVVEDLANMPWSKLGQMRENLGQFNPFYK